MSGLAQGVERENAPSSIDMSAKFPPPMVGLAVMFAIRVLLAHTIKCAQ